jgi:hypothetical protein
MSPHINYLAVLVAVVINVVLGFIWYGPLFGKAWSKMLGIDMSHKPGSGAMGKSMFFMLVGSFLMAWTLDHSLIFGNAYLGMSGVFSGIMGAFYIWLGFVAPVTLGPVLWENKPWKLWFINAGYYLVAMCLMAIVLTSWV